MGYGTAKDLFSAGASQLTLQIVGSKLCDDGGGGGRTHNLRSQSALLWPF